MQTTSCPYPWQTEQWQKLRQRAQQAKLPHALLIAGAPGIGKFNFVQAFANTLLCATGIAENRCCGNCRGCHLLQTEAHPDFKLLAAPEGSSVIKIDQIRQLIEWLSTTSQLAGCRIAIIQSAELLNNAAANALLKTLEEPNPNTYIFLVSHKPAALSATIRSRCQKLVLSCSDSQQALAWLKLQLPDYQNHHSLLRMADGSPLQALTLANTQQLQLRQQLFTNLNQITQGAVEPIKLAAQWLNLEMESLLTWLVEYVEDLIRLNCKLPSQYLKHGEWLAGSTTQFKIKSLFKYYDKLFATKGLYQRNANLNQQLVLEELFYEWSKIHAK